METRPREACELHEDGCLATRLLPVIILALQTMLSRSVDRQTNKQKQFSGGDVLTENETSLRLGE